MNRPGRLCAVAAFLACAALVGCVQLPYCLPEINYAPPIDANCKSDEVYAFRVDVTQRTEIKEGIDAVAGKVVEYQLLTRVHPSADGTTPSQFGFTCASGWRYVGFYNFTSASTEHGITMRFYRPGYETISVKPGEGTTELQWRKAPDLDSQVRAIEELLRGTSPREAPKVTAKQVLEPGTKSAAHRDALLFGAKEYERLARDLTEPEEQRTRQNLIGEARRLRALADGK